MHIQADWNVRQNQPRNKLPKFILTRNKLARVDNEFRKLTKSGSFYTSVTERSAYMSVLITLIILRIAVVRTLN